MIWGRRTLAVALWIAGACGRVGFDPTGAGVDGASGDGTTPRANVAFVTSTAHTAGQLGSLTAADAICMARADAQGLPGTFVAWMSTTTVRARDRLGTARGWTRVDGLMVADTIDDLSSNNIVHPISLDESGFDVAAGSQAASHWTVTATQDGHLAPPNCDDFTSTTGDVLVGAPNLAHHTWSARAWFPCTDLLSLYCLQTDHAVPLAIPQSTGRLAFVSEGLFTPSSGIASADAICANEAAAAGRPGTFLAMLPEGTSVAATRFDATGPPWVRSDGVALAPTAVAVIQDAATAPLDRTAGGLFVDERVMTGADSPDSQQGNDCAGWTSSAGGSNYGNTNSAGGGMFNDTSALCLMPMPVYCFER